MFSGRRFFLSESNGLKRSLRNIRDMRFQADSFAQFDEGVCYRMYKRAHGVHTSH